MEKQFSYEVPKNVASWHEEGKKAGLKVKSAEESADLIAREYLLVMGGYLGKFEGDHLVPSAADWMTGYCSAWSNPNTQKSRKTEVKAIFEAFAMGDQEREFTVRKDDVNDETTGKKKQVDVKETHSIRDWLLMHQELPGYDGLPGLYALAKLCRGPAKGSGSGGGANRGPRAVTDKQQGEIEQRIEVMNSNQAQAVVQRGLSQLSKLPPITFEIVQFRAIVQACDLILNKSTDPRVTDLCVKMADKIRGWAEDTIERLKEQMKASEKALVTPKITSAAPAPQAQAEATAPAPAEAEQKAA